MNWKIFKSPGGEGYPLYHFLFIQDTLLTYLSELFYLGVSHSIFPNVKDRILFGAKEDGRSCLDPKRYLVPI